MGGTTKIKVNPTNVREVMVRPVFFIHSRRQLDSLIKDNVVFTILSERRLGPKLFAVFAEGRLEEFVPSRSVKQYCTWSLKHGLLIHLGSRLKTDYGRNRARIQHTTENPPENPP